MARNKSYKITLRAKTDADLIALSGSYDLKKCLGIAFAKLSVGDRSPISSPVPGSGHVGNRAVISMPSDLMPDFFVNYISDKPESLQEVYIKHVLRLYLDPIVFMPGFPGYSVYPAAAQASIGRNTDYSGSDVLHSKKETRTEGFSSASDVSINKNNDRKNEKKSSANKNDFPGNPPTLSLKDLVNPAESESKEKAKNISNPYGDVNDSPEHIKAIMATPELREANKAEIEKIRKKKMWENDQTAKRMQDSSPYTGDVRQDYEMLSRQFL